MLNRRIPKLLSIAAVGLASFGLAAPSLATPTLKNHEGSKLVTPGEKGQKTKKHRHFKKATMKHKVKAKRDIKTDKTKK